MRIIALPLILTLVCILALSLPSAAAVTAHLERWPTPEYHPYTPASLNRSTAATTRLYGAVYEAEDVRGALDVLRQPRYLPLLSSPPPPSQSRSFMDYAVIDSVNVRQSEYKSIGDSQLVLLFFYDVHDPFSVSLARSLPMIAAAFPTVLVVSVDGASLTAMNGDEMYEVMSAIKQRIRHRVPFINIDGVIPQLWRILTSTSSSSLPSEPITLSVQSRYLVRALPSLLLFSDGWLIDSITERPFDSRAIIARIARLTDITPVPVIPLYDLGDTGGGSDDWLNPDWQTVEELERSFSSQHGLLWAIAGTVIVHLLQRFKNKLDALEVELMARNHVAM